MLLRAISGLIFLLIVISAVLYSNYTLALLFLIITGGASFELCKLFNYYFKTTVNPYVVSVTPVLMYFIAALLTLNLIDRNYQTLFLIMLIIIFLAPLYLAIFLYKKNILVYLFSVYFCLLYILLPIIFLTINTKFGKNTNDYQYSYFLSFFILIWANDTFAYLSGKLLGKHKLWENISPNKTIEGFAGGVVFTILSAYLLKKIGWMNVHTMQAISISIFVSLAATVGDLFESKLKRLANVKDSGNIMPGHGGFLDRFDGVLFAAPVYVILTNF